LQCGTDRIDPINGTVQPDPDPRPLEHKKMPFTAPLAMPGLLLDKGLCITRNLARLACVTLSP
jgi:hypothetical protein